MKGVTDFKERTHCFKANISEEYQRRLEEDKRMYFRVTGPMVSWMDQYVCSKFFMNALLF
jgi:hypothetical protein